jgi:cellulose synthase/poly-beta-1,6-N-acetylglucosamine synthase-like glycosyltransferase
MFDLLLVPLASVYLLVVGALFVYGINFLYLSFVAWRTRPTTNTGSGTRQLSEFPAVTVQLPIYNELYVAERIINAVANLDYPADLLQIQVLDDSTDETKSIVATAVEAHRNRGVNIVHLVRSNREGYKAGALQMGLAQAEGEYIAMFDADFVPPADFLKQMLPAFKPNTAFVQARWGHLNRDYSLLTALQSVAIDGHFVVEQFARWVSGLWFNFNGTAGVWRRIALEDAGGWSSDTLTEDLDISYRALLKGWSAEYLRDVVIPAELPVSMIAFRRQQHRWARGSLECALKLGPRVWATSTSLKMKLSATLHLTGYAIHILLLLLTLLYPAVLLLAEKYPQLVTLFGMAVFFNVTSLAPTIFFIVGQNQLGRRWWRNLHRILFVTVVGSGLMVNTVRASLQILTRKDQAFERTAKFGLVHKQQSWAEKKYQLRLDPIVAWELILSSLNLATAWYALRLGYWVFAVYAIIFAVGLFYVSGTTIMQAVAVYRKQRAILRSGRFERIAMDEEQTHSAPSLRPTVPNTTSARRVLAPSPRRSSRTDQ